MILWYNVINPKYLALDKCIGINTERLLIYLSTVVVKFHDKIQSGIHSWDCEEDTRELIVPFSFDITPSIAKNLDVDEYNFISNILAKIGSVDNAKKLVNIMNGKAMNQALMIIGKSESFEEAMEIIGNFQYKCLSHESTITSDKERITKEVLKIFEHDTIDVFIAGIEREIRDRISISPTVLKKCKARFIPNTIKDKDRKWAIEELIEGFYMASYSYKLPPVELLRYDTFFLNEEHYNTYCGNSKLPSWLNELLDEDVKYDRDHTYDIQICVYG